MFDNKVIKKIIASGCDESFIEDVHSLFDIVRCDDCHTQKEKELIVYNCKSTVERINAAAEEKGFERFYTKDEHIDFEKDLRDYVLGVVKQMM